MSKSKLVRTELEYLGYWITRNGIKPLNKKVEAINNLAAPKTRKELRQFIGLVNYYRDLFPKRSETMAPLMALTSKTTKWKWTAEHQISFENMKKIVARHVILSYPDFSKPVEIYTDASKVQLGSVISQNNQPIVFYSRKLSQAQTRYTTTERELLSIVETLKEFQNILLGQQIIVYTDHENLTYKNFNSDRVMRWRLFIEEYSPDLKYRKGEKNIVADALSRLNLTQLPRNEGFFTTEVEADLYCYAKTKKQVQQEEEEHCPLTYQLIGKEQSKDVKLMSLATAKMKGYNIATFLAADKKWDLICYGQKIVIPKILQTRIINWYHNYLGHPGINRTEETIGQHLWWPKMRSQITPIVSTCESCQSNKRRFKKYGLLPEQVAEAQPWDKLCVDLIGPY